MNKIAKIVYGSNLYGTNTPDSDLDIKGIYLPSIEDLYLQRVKDSIGFDTSEVSVKNTSEDTDEEYYSLHYFLKLACRGDTCALDLLHAPPSKVLLSNPIWKLIVSHRKKFYTKNLASFINFAKTQAVKYSVKGDKLNEVREMMLFLGGLEPLTRLRDVWDDIPTGEYLTKYPSSEEQNNLRTIEICGRRLQETTSAEYAYKVAETISDRYGERAKLAATNSGIDWKALSHAVRAAFQIKSILKEGTITFPLAIADELRDIKLGKLDYTAVVVPKLEELIEEVEALLKVSELPEEVDREFWDNLILEVYNEWGE